MTTSKRKPASVKKTNPELASFFKILKKKLAAEVEPSLYVALIALALAFVTFRALGDMNRELGSQRDYLATMSQTQPRSLLPPPAHGGGCVHTKS